MMTVVIKFTETSRYYKRGRVEEKFTDVSEIHYNFNNTGCIAIESDIAGSGHIYSIDDIAELEAT